MFMATELTQCLSQGGHKPLLGHFAGYPRARSTGEPTGTPRTETALSISSVPETFFVQRSQGTSMSHIVHYVAKTVMWRRLGRCPFPDSLHRWNAT